MTETFTHIRLERPSVSGTPSPKKKGRGDTMLGRGSARGMADVTKEDKGLSLEICFGIMFGVTGLAVIGIGHYISSEEKIAIYVGYALFGLGCFMILVRLLLCCQRKAKEDEIKKVMKRQSEGGSYTYNDEGMTVTLVYGERKESVPMEV